MAGPPDVSSFEDLPWLFKVVHKVVHKSLACRCQDLMRGDGCCDGYLTEVSFLGLRSLTYTVDEETATDSSPTAG